MSLDPADRYASVHALGAALPFASASGRARLAHVFETEPIDPRDLTSFESQRISVSHAKDGDQLIYAAGGTRLLPPPLAGGRAARLPLPTTPPRSPTPLRMNGERAPRPLDRPRWILPAAVGGVAGLAALVSVILALVRPPATSLDSHGETPIPASAPSPLSPSPQGATPVITARPSALQEAATTPGTTAMHKSPATSQLPSDSASPQDGVKPVKKKRRTRYITTPSGTKIPIIR
jgi:hypothetical protein